MRETLKRLAKLTAGYSLVTLIGPIFTILLTPLYTRVLTPADYGVVDVATAIFSLLSAIAVFSIDTALGVHYFDHDTSNQGNLVVSALATVAGISMMISLVIAFFSGPLAEILYQDRSRQSILLLVALNVFTAPLYFVSIAAMRLRMDVRRVNAVGLAYLLTAVASNILFILFLHLHATGVMMASVLAYGTAASVGVLLGLHAFKGSPKASFVQQLLRVGGSLLPGTLSFLLLAGSDRILLTQYVSQTQIGLYAIANKLGSMTSIVMTTIWSAWWPLALEMADKPDAKQQYARVFEYFLLLSAIVSLVIGLFAPEILKLFTRSEYFAAAPYTLALMPYFGPLQIAASCFSIGLYITKRTHLISIALALAAATNIVLNLKLNPYIGVWGAIIATLAGSALYAVCIYFFSQRQFRVTYRWLRAVAFAGIYISVIILFLTFPALNQVWIKLLGILIMLIASLIVGIISITQIQLGTQMIWQQIGRVVKART